MFNRITIVGLGLIGGSIALAVRAHHAQSYIVGYDISSKTLKKALRSKYIDIATPTLKDAVINSDLIIICSPLSTYSAIAETIGHYASSNAIITDVGSVKLCTVNACNSIIGRFVPAHPIAGKASSGIEAADSNLFLNKKIILTPSSKTAIHAVHQVTQFWQSLGGNTEEMSALQHDTLYAALSHLPQALLFCEAALLHSLPMTPALQQHLRIAKSSPQIWTDIFIANYRALIPLLEQMIQRIPLITHSDIERAKHARQSLNDTVIYLDTLPALSYLIACFLVEVSPNLQYAGSGFRDVTACLLQYKTLPLATEGYQTSLLLAVHQLLRLIRDQNSSALNAYLNEKRL